MRVTIAGGSGFLGRALGKHLNAMGHEVTALSRRAGSPASKTVQWEPNGQVGPWASAPGVIDGADAVVNLAGESIAAKRWSPAQKERILRSRLDATRSLAGAIAAAKRPPPVFISGSAVGYYGDRGDETLTETSSAGGDFLADVCRQWEAAAQPAAIAARIAFVRTGVVLDRHEGALPQMLLPFKLFAGGPVGSGRQYIPWIHRDDWVAMVAWAIGHEGAHGPLNATSPNPVTNREFAKAVGRAMHRPALLPAPAFALRIALGEMADALLLSGQRALPVRATDLGFRFVFNSVDEALASVLQ